MIVPDLSVLTSLYRYLLETGDTRKCFLPHLHYFCIKQIFAVKDSWLYCMQHTDTAILGLHL